MSEPDLVPCKPPGVDQPTNLDSIPPYCRESPTESLNDEPGRDFSWLEEATMEKLGNGASALCDPMQRGHIINDQDGKGLEPGTLNRYSKAFRGCDEAMMDLFRDLVVIDEAGKAHNIPIIWGTQEKAVAAIVQENVRKDDSLVVDRIRLPMLAIHGDGEEFDLSRYTYHRAIDYLRDFGTGRPGFTVKERYEKDTVFGVTRGLPINKSYTLYAWTLYREDMNQIVEQVISKFSMLAYIRVRGVSWEVGVRLESIGNNIEVDPGDQAINVYKYKFTLVAETYVPQSIYRKKAVLKVRTEVVDGLDDAAVTDVISRLEEAVKELQ